MAKRFILYHGASLADAIAMVGPPASIDVSLGSGEFGQGFYMTPSRGLAASLAIARSSRNLDAALVQVAFDEQHYATLRVKELDHASSNHLRQTLAARDLLGADVVVGTIQDRPRRLQFKFESPAAQDLLNTVATLSLVRL